MISKSFIKSSLTYTVIGSLPFASSILLLPFYGNKNLLSTNDFGLLAIFIILSELARILLSYSAESFLGNAYIHYRDDDKRTKRFLGTSFVFMLLYGLAITFIISIAGSWLFELIYPSKPISFYPFGFLSVITGLFNGIFKAYTSHLIFREKPLPYFWSNIAHFSLVLITSISGLYLFPQTLIGPIWGRFIGALATFIWSIVFFVRAGKLSWDKEVLNHLIRYSTPIYVHNLLYWVISNIDRYIILGLLNQNSVAVFDFAIKITLAIEFLQNGLSAAILPKVFHMWKSRNDASEGSVEINRYFHVFILVNVTLIPLYLLLVPELVPIVVNNNDLYDSFKLLPLLFAGMIVRVWYYILVSPALYFQKTSILPKVFAITAAFQIITTYLLISTHQLNGAVLANFTTKVLQVALLYHFVSKFYAFNTNKLKTIIFPVLVVILLILSQYLIQFVSGMVVYSILMIVVVILAYMVYKKEISISRFKEMLTQ